MKAGGTLPPCTRSLSSRGPRRGGGGSRGRWATFLTRLASALEPRARCAGDRSLAAGALLSSRRRRRRALPRRRVCARLWLRTHLRLRRREPSALERERAARDPRLADDACARAARCRDGARLRPLGHHDERDLLLGEAGALADHRSAERMQAPLQRLARRVELEALAQDPRDRPERQREVLLIIIRIAAKPNADAHPAHPKWTVNAAASCSAFTKPFSL
eukprot:4365242-Pleurochrysis_carterae.AAC.5